MPKMTNRLKVLRAEHDLTQEQLARAVGATRSTINYLEKNEYTPSLPLAVRIARYFGRPVEEVFIINDETV